MIETGATTRAGLEESNGDFGQLINDGLKVGGNRLAFGFSSFDPDRLGSKNCGESLFPSLADCGTASEIRDAAT